MLTEGMVVNIKNNYQNKNLIDHLSKAVKQIKHGHIELVIQDSKIIQLNKTEKIRLDNVKKRSSS